MMRSILCLGLALLLVALRAAAATSSAEEEHRRHAEFVQWVQGIAAQHAALRASSLTMTRERAAAADHAAMEASASGGFFGDLPGVVLALLCLPAFIVLVRFLLRVPDDGTEVPRPEAESLAVQARPAVISPTSYIDFDLTEMSSLEPGVQWESAHPLPKGTYWLIRIEGVVRCPRAWKSADVNYADAYVAWKEGTAPGRRRPHSALFIEGSDTPACPFIERRAEHAYTYVYRAPGGCAHVYFEPHVADRHQFSGTFTVILERAPSALMDQIFDGIFTLYGVMLTDGEKRVTRERQQAQPKIAALVAEFTDQPDLNNPRFLDEYAQANHADILTSADEILADHRALQAQFELVFLLKSKHPAIYERRLWRFRVLERVKRAELARAAASQGVVSSAEARREKTMQFRERAVERERVRIEDDQAMAWVGYEAVEAILDAREVKIEEITAREDLSPESKEERILGVRAMAEQQLEKLLRGSSHDTTGTTSTPGADAPIVLG